VAVQVVVVVVAAVAMGPVEHSIMLGRPVVAS
jgi:hypothetical protein